MQLSPEIIQQFQKHILDWFSINKRDLPWRRTRDPYAILVSEVMLQQTQAPRVIPKYQLWLEKFPTIESLSHASTHDVLSLWSGLGYNRRALYLQKAAKILVEKYNGKFPDDEKTLRELPGIGEYTARAVLCFAFDKQIAVVDTNVRKVILTQFPGPEPHLFEPEPQSRRPNPFPLSSKRAPAVRLLKGEGISIPSSPLRERTEVRGKILQNIADQLLPIGKAYEWNQALMDYASAVLKKEKIPIKKQSKFKDSDRYYRGQIIKLLIAHRRLHIEELYGFLKKTSEFNQERFKSIVKKLEKDTLIARRGSHLTVR